MLPVGAPPPALAKISANKQRIVFCVDADGVLVGSLSDGDIRRWLLAQPTVELATPTQSVARRDCASAPIDAAVLAERSWSVLEECPGWVDRSPLTFELAEEIWAALVVLEQRPDDAEAMAALDRCSARYAELYADATAINQDLLQQSRLAARREGAAEARSEQEADGPLVAEVGGRDLLREVGRRAVRRLRPARL